MHTEHEKRQDDVLIDLGQASVLTQGDFDPLKVENGEIEDFRD